MLAGAMARVEPVVQGAAEIARARGIFRDAEIGEDEVEEIVDIEMRIENEGDGDFTFAKGTEEVIDERGLAGAGLSAEDDEIFSGLEAGG